MKNPRAAVLSLFGLLGFVSAPILAGDAPTPATDGIAAAAPGAANAGVVKRLWLPQTRSDWDALVAEIPSSALHSGRTADGTLEEVTVLAPTELVPMQDVYSEMWGGILAPLWAIRHPTQAWRIFLPIPPK